MTVLVSTVSPGSFGRRSPKPGECGIQMFQSIQPIVKIKMTKSKIKNLKLEKPISGYILWIQIRDLFVSIIHAKLCATRYKPPATLCEKLCTTVVKSKRPKAILSYLFQIFL
jgi:hypothetical protein